MSAQIAARRTNISILFLLGITVIWGLTFPLIKDSLKYITPVSFLFWRFFIATVVCYPIFAQKIKADAGRSLKPGVVIGVALFLGFFAQTLGMKFTTANKSAFITSMYVVGVPFLSFFLERKNVSVRAIISVLVACVGLYFLVRPEASGVNVGDLLTMGCAIAFGAQIVLTNIYTKIYDGSAILFYELLSTAILSFIVPWFWLGWSVVWNVKLLIALLYVSVLATTLNIYVQNRFQKNITAAHAALVYTTEPIFASIFAFILLGETFAPIAFFGAGLIFIGLIVASVRAKNKSL